MTRLSGRVQGERVPLTVHRQWLDVFCLGLIIVLVAQWFGACWKTERRLIRCMVVSTLGMVKLDTCCVSSELARSERGGAECAVVSIEGLRR